MELPNYDVVRHHHSYFMHPTKETAHGLDRAWKVAPALACGCTIVMKPSEFTPLSALVRAPPSLFCSILWLFCGACNLAQNMESPPDATFDHFSSAFDLS